MQFYGFPEWNEHYFVILESYHYALLAVKECLYSSISQPAGVNTVKR